MQYLKLFESYTEDQYRTALKNIKNMIQKDRKKEDVLTFISKYYSDDAKYLDNIRIIINRIVKEYSLFKRGIYHSPTPIKRKGEVVNKYVEKYYFMLDEVNKVRLDKFLEIQKKEYHDNISKLSKPVSSSIEFLFRKLFELLDWINETGMQKSEIFKTHYLNQRIAISKIELVNTLDFDDEVEEFTNLTNRCLANIKRAIISA